MNKTELTKYFASKAEISMRESEQFVNLMVDALTSALMKEERVEIRGFGSFTIRHYDAYKGRNPKNGKAIKVPAKRLPFFKAGKDLLERVNNGK